MSIKSLTAFLTAVIICVLCTSCTKELNAASSTTAIATNTAKPTLAPTPEPKVGLEAVFGKEEISIAVVSNADETVSALFFEGAQKEAQSMGVNLITTAGVNSLEGAVSEAAQNGADAIIACLMEEPSNYSFLGIAADEGLPVCVFEMQKGDVPVGVSHVYYNPSNEEAIAFNAALVYPPHDTPVRLILMFESRETKAYATYEKLYTEGKIFPKEIYIATEDEDNAPKEWLEKRLQNYVEGMLDGIFAENSGLAIGAIDALESLSRTDMEVFSIGLTSDIVARMSKNPEVFAQSIGSNTVLAGLLSIRASLIALYGGDFISLELSPSLVSAADFGQDIVMALSITDSAFATLYNEAWMDTLREHYEK